MQYKDFYLDDLKAKMTNIAINIQPTNKNWKDLPLEMLVDEG